MKCTNKIGILVCLLTMLLLAGCKGKSYDIPYDLSTSNSAYKFESNNSEATVKTFASGLCVTSKDVNLGKVDMNMATSAGLFDVTRGNVIYAKNIHKAMNPASLTKVMTAYVALKYGKLDDMITASANVNIKEPGAQLCGFKEGDKITLDQALHGLLMYSGNDAAVMIAEYISGSVDEFATLMNKEARALGATNSNFVNPHGLTDDNHLTTAYDLYLIFNAAMRYEKFKELIHMAEYTMKYTNAEGEEKEMTFKSSNYYTSDHVKAPSGITVIGGKTGTTKAAGSCLILLTNNNYGESFISVVLKAQDKESLYNEMNNLLVEIP